MDWKRKLASRKLWAAISGFATAIIVFFNLDSEYQVKIVSLIGAFGSVIAYIIGESYVDGQYPTEY